MLTFGYLSRIQVRALADCDKPCNIVTLNFLLCIVEGVPIGVFEVKRSGADAEVMASAAVHGQMYDHLMRLKNFHGLKHVFGILSTYTSWRIFWLPNPNTDTYAAQTVCAVFKPLFVTHILIDCS